MRRLLALALLVACDAGELPKKPVPMPTPTPTPDPVPVVPEEPPVVEVIHNVPGVKLDVSSQVNNRRILPKHLIDGDLNTAWNSRTDQLVGSWIDIEAPQGTRMRELRMTVGHTGKGKRGEDYFTMNPRIVKVLVSMAGGEKMVTLDPTKRELQSIPIEESESVRVTIAELRMGTRAEWREVAISELQAWGTPPPGTQSVATAPEVVVPDDFCTRLDALNVEREKSRQEQGDACARIKDEEQRRMCGEDPAGNADCWTRELEDAHVQAPWSVPEHVCEMWDNNFGPTTCWVRIETDTQMLLALPADDGGGPLGNHPKATVKDVVKGGAPELVIRNSMYEDRPEDDVVICRATPLACTAPEPARTAFAHPPVFR